jgi:peptidoglycan/LPS O-acetylase OafA/YrhL
MVAALSVAVAIASWMLVERPVIEAAGRWRPGPAASPPSRPTATSGRRRAWRETRDDGVGLVHDVVVVKRMTR